jgi:hypothetical protein
MDQKAKSSADAGFDGRPAWTPPPLRGVEAPSRTTPALQVGQLRRTSTVDTLRPEGLDGPRLIRGRARDVIATVDGIEVLAEADLVCATDPRSRSLSFTVAGQPVAGFDGVLVGAGFRQKALERFPEARAAESPLWTLLDDLPTATMVSNYVRLYAGFQPPWVAEGRAPKADICSGWRSEGTLVQDSLRAGRQVVTPGPAAPDLGAAGWHEMERLAKNGGRRRRRLDLTLGEVLIVEAMFRDTMASGEAGEDVVIHEYGLRAEVDPVSLTVLSVEAEPHVLPYVECPAAAASAGRIVGLKLTELRDRVRVEFTGVSTCTHLNDLLRSLEDVAGLLADRGGMNAKGG